MSSKYREQHERIKRWWTRIERLDSGRRHDAASENYVDEIYAFFMNCYHLKDWIKHDTELADSIRQAVETYINGQPTLKLCADICNSVKHLTLKSSRSRESPKFGRKKYALKLGAGPPIISLKYYIETTNGLIDGFQLASQCVDAWDAFLIRHGLLGNPEGEHEPDRDSTSGG